MENFYEQFLLETQAEAHRLKKLLNLHNQQQNEECVQRIQSILQRALHNSDKGPVIKTILHSILNQVSSISITNYNQYKDKKFMDKRANLLLALIQVIGFLMCHWEVDNFSFNLLLQQYDISISIQDWFINDITSYTLLSVYLILHLHPSKIAFHKEYVTFEGILRDITKEIFFRELFSECMDLYKLNHHFDNQEYIFQIFTPNGKQTLQKSSLHNVKHH